jgi:hypothetical protein
MPIAFVLARLPGEWRTRLIRHAALTAAPALVSGTALLFYAHLAPLLPVIALSALLLVLLAWAQWRELPKEVHDRILGLLSRAAKRGRNAL